MRSAIRDCEEHGALFDSNKVDLVEADMDGVLPENFYSTTNFTTHLCLGDDWIEVENLEMDCGIGFGRKAIVGGRKLARCTAFAKAMRYSWVSMAFA